MEALIKHGWLACTALSSSGTQDSEWEAEVFLLALKLVLSKVSASCIFH